MSRRRVPLWRAGETTRRGYGWDHQEAKRKALRGASPTDPCSRCGLPLGEIRGDRLDLDHDDDDRGTPTAGNYRGLAHSACNRRAGAAKAGRRLAAKGDRQRAYRRRVLGLPDLEEAEPVRELSPSRRRQVEAWRSPELAAANRVAAAQLGTTPEELARRWEGRQGGDAYLPLCWDAGPALRDEGAA